MKVAAIVIWSLRVGLDGLIQTGAGHGSILLSDHKTYVTRGSGSIRGIGTGRTLADVIQITGGVLILGPDNEINGQVRLLPLTVNYGAIDPGYTNSAGGHLMRLTCEPKLGPGEWGVTGGSVNNNIVEVWAPIAGSGGLTLNGGGFLLMHRSMVLYGSLVANGGSVSIDPEVLFDVGGLSPTDCPEAEE